MIELDFRLGVGDRSRRFELDVRLRSARRAVALFGASGAGKSLTLAAVAGLRAPRSGSIALAGRTLFDSAGGVSLPARERGVGLLFQHYALFPHLTVRQNVAFGLTRWFQRLTRPEAERVDALLARLGLSAHASARPAALSGGQQQRVALARALACRPSALLLDEPLAALNAKLRRHLRAELRATLADTALPLMLVTHDVDDVLELAEEAFLIDEGRIVGRVDLSEGDAAARLHDFAAA